MSSQSESLQAVELADTFITNIALFAEATLIFYEYANTIDNEVRLIWRRRITGASVIFFLNRYIMIADSIITIASFPAMSNLSCYALGWIDVVLSVLPYFLWNAFTTMRVYAVSGRDWRIAAVVCILNIGPIVGNVYNIPFEFPVNMPPPLNCTFDNTLSIATHTILVLISRVPLIAGDAIVILVTWWKTYKLKKAADEARVTTSLVDLLLRDGSIYFGTMLVLNSLHIMMNHVAKVSFMGDVADVVTSILISRFIMNLRDIDTGGPGSRSTGYEVGGPGSWHAMTQRSAGGGHGDTVVFANDLVGSMGGTLERSMWAQSRFHTPEPAGVIREDAEPGSPVSRESGEKRSR